VDAPPRRAGRRLRQAVQREDTDLGDLAARRWNSTSVELFDDIDRDMIAPGEVAVEQQAVQARAAERGDAGFLAQLAHQRFLRRLADLDPAAGQMPARHIAVAYQQDGAGLVDHQRFYPERHAARQPPPAMYHPGEKTRSHAGLLHGRRVRAAFHRGAGADKETPVFVLAHLTDAHLGPLPRARFAELAGKRALGVLNWRRGRQHRFNVATIDLLVADIKAMAPDHIAVTGDLVNVGLAAEFATGLNFLKSLGEGHDVTVVPGNHDAYVRSTAHHSLLNWGDYMRGDGVNGDVTDESAFPFIRRREGVALIGVSTAIPTRPFMATGKVGREQRERLAQALEQLGAEGLFRVVLIHHPPCGIRAGHKRLIDETEVRAVLARYGAELVICGHDHVPMVEMLPGPNGGLIPVVEAPSFAAGPEDRHWPGGYHLYRIERVADAPFPWRCSLESRGFQRGEVAVDTRTRRVLSGSLSAG
jgi:3',5'-cyclic AMP phosphodiesterase CpdA